MTAADTILPASLRRPLRLSIPPYVLFITWASLRTSTGGGHIPHLDKILHAGVYGLLALGIGLAWPNISKVKIWIVAVLYGAVMEIAQGTLTAARTPSILDFTANAVGAAAALVFIVFLTQKLAR